MTDCVVVLFYRQGLCGKLGGRELRGTMWESCGRGDCGGGSCGGGAVQVKHFECHFMHAPPTRGIQCVHMYSVSGT